MAGNRAGGVVVLRMEIDANGVPQNIQVVRSLSQYFDRNAKYAAGLWRFRPAMRGNTPVPAWVRIQIGFQIAGARGGRRSLNDPK